MGQRTIMRGVTEWSIGFGTQLWLLWASIALDHRDEARERRKTDGGPPANNPELKASMIAISAAAFAVDGLAADVRQVGTAPQGLSDRRRRAVVVAATLAANFELGDRTNHWPSELKQLFQLRSASPGGGLAHPTTTFGEPVALPEIRTAPARTTYTVETAEWATRLMSDIAICCSADRLRRDASPELRDRVTGYRTYAAEFARRA